MLRRSPLSRPTWPPPSARWLTLPFELDLAGTNFPDVTPLVHPAVTRNTSQCALLACIARSLGACRGRDAAMLRAAFFEPATAAFTAACEAARLVTGAHDGTVCVWEARTGKLLKQFDAWPQARR